MKSDNKGTAIMLSMFGALPVALASFGLAYATCSTALMPVEPLTLVQVILPYCAGFAFRLAIFRFLYVSQKTPG